MNFIKKNLLFAFLLTSGFMFGQEFERYDLNDDDQWDEEEFGSFYSDDYYNTWDSDEDTQIEENEFYDNTFENTDDNNNNGINEEEFEDGSNDMFGDYADTADFGTFDEDNDGIVDSNEWNEGFADTNWFSDYDANNDEYLDNNELNDGVFDNWDNNSDGYLDENEIYDNDNFYDTGVSDTW